MSIVLLNKQFLDDKDAALSIHERAASFGDGVYEVMRLHAGRLHAPELHIKRLRQSLAGISLPIDENIISQLPDQALAVARHNHIDNGKIYIQISRGPAPRDHVIPSPPPTPTVLCTATAMPAISMDTPIRHGSAISIEDTRWQGCCYKTLMLLPNSLAKTHAVQQGAIEALFLRKQPGPIRYTEGCATNLYAVIDGVIRTHPADTWILPGVTRKLLLEDAESMKLKIEQRGFSPDELKNATEVFVSGTISLITAITSVDGQQIGNAQPGPVSSSLYHALLRRIVEEGK